MMNKIIIMGYVCRTVLTRKVTPETDGLATTPKHVQEFIENCGDDVFSPSTEEIESSMDELVKIKLLEVYGKKHGEQTTYAMPVPVG